MTHSHPLNVPTIESTRCHHNCSTVLFLTPAAARLTDFSRTNFKPQEKYVRHDLFTPRKFVHLRAYLVEL
uniref:Uncharacterized protein n=1 Tax=Oryza brachyantha TaxID=4533 RepID=J3MP84_ORYBR